MKLINELGELAMATRLVRLSEMTRTDVTRIYMEMNIDFESKWFPVLYVLSQKKMLSVIELADEIGYSHPSVIALVREMEQKNLVRSTVNKTDKRKRMLSLKPKAKSMISILKPVWDNFRIANEQIYNNGSSLLKAVEDTEAALAREGFYDRYKKIEARSEKRTLSKGTTK